MEITLKPKRQIPKDDTEILEMLVQFQLGLSCTQEKVDFLYDELYKFRETKMNTAFKNELVNMLIDTWKRQVSEITLEDLQNPTPLSIMTMVQLSKLKLTLLLKDPQRLGGLFYGT
jgi:hypothetical protein